MEEKITLTDGHSEIQFKLWWSKQWCDMVIQNDEGSETVARLMFIPYPETLRTIADQFYQWAETIENEVEPMQVKG